MKPGTPIAIPGIPGRWSIWSKSNETPGGHFAVPLDAEARDYGVKYAVVRIRKPKNAETVRIQALRTDPHKYEPP